MNLSGKTLVDGFLHRFSKNKRKLKKKNIDKKLSCKWEGEKERGRKRPTKRETKNQRRNNMIEYKHIAYCDVFSKLVRTRTSKYRKRGAILAQIKVDSILNNREITLIKIYLGTNFVSLFVFCFQIKPSVISLTCALAEFCDTFRLASVLTDLSGLRCACPFVVFSSLSLSFLIVMKVIYMKKCRRPIDDNDAKSHRECGLTWR